MKRLKILHTTTRIVHGGGVEHNVMITLDHLKDQFDFHLLSGRENHVSELYKTNGFKVLTNPHLIREVSPENDLKALLFLYRLIKKEQYDIVHTHETKASLLSRIAAYFAGCPFIIYGLHGVTFNDPMSRLKKAFFVSLEKWTVWMSDFIVSVGQDTIDEYHKHGIARKMPYQVVRSGIDLDQFEKGGLHTEEEKREFRKQWNIQSDESVLLSVGRFSYSKAQRYTIEAFAFCLKTISDLKLIFVGDGELIEKCKKQAKKLGIEKNVFFVGYAKNVQDFLSIADLFVITSLREGLPRVTVEASLKKVPVVGFQVEGISEVITDGESGFIVPQYDVVSLEKKIIELLKDSEKRKQFAEKAYRFVKKEWDAKKMIKDLETIYKSNILHPV